MQEEAGSFENVDEYKAVRGIAWLYNQSGQSEQAAIQKYAQKNGCTEETAAKFLALAKQNRSRVPFYQTIQDEDSEETGEDVSRDDHWDYAEIVRLAEWDTIKTSRHANRVIMYLLNCANEKLPKEMVIALEV